MLAFASSALHGHRTGSWTWEIPHFRPANHSLPQLFHAVGRDVMLTLASLRNRKSLLGLLPSHVGKGINVLCLKISRDMDTKCPQIRQCTKGNICQRHWVENSPEYYNFCSSEMQLHFRSLSVYPGSWTVVWCFWQHWSTWLHPSRCLDACCSLVPHCVCTWLAK